MTGTTHDALAGAVKARPEPAGAHGGDSVNDGRWPGSLRKRVQEDLVVRTFSSPDPAGWIACHRWLSFAFKLLARRRVLTAARRDVDHRVMTFGPRKRFDELLGTLFDDVRQVERGSRIPAWRPPASRHTEGADLVAVDVHPWFASRFRGAAWHVVPTAVRWTGDPEDLPPEDPSKSLASDLRKLRGADFTHEVTRGSAADWEVFYAQMVRPHALARFGPDAWLPSPWLRRAWRARGRLLFLRSGGRRVAGACLVGEGPRLWSPLVGFRHDDVDWLAEGAHAALNLGLIRWARERGVRTLDLGRTGPFPEDGLARYKRKWGLEPTPDPLAHRVAISEPRSAARPPSPFRDQPVFLETGAGLVEYAGPDPGAGDSACRAASTP